MLGIDDPICWMNNTQPQVLDLWVAHLLIKSEQQDKKQLRPADEVLGEIGRKLMQ